MSGNLQFSDLYAILSKYTVSDIKSKHIDIVTVMEDDTVQSLLEALLTKNILSVPVFSPSQAKFIGMVDVMDIVSFTLSLISEGDQQITVTKEKVEAVSQTFGEEPVSKVIDASNNDPYCPVFGGAPLLQLVEVFAKGIRRVCIYRNDETDIVNLVSQSDIVKFLNLHADEMRAIFDVSIEELAFEDSELNFGRGTPITVHSSTVTAQAYHELFCRSVSAVGVVNDNNELIGNLSASDLRKLSKDSFVDLILPVSEFIAKYSPQSASPVTLPPTATLSEFITLLANSSLHRVWVVEDNKQPVGVVSLSDIMNIFAYYATRNH